MDGEDRARIEKILRDRRLAHEALLASGSRTYRGFLDMEAAAYGEGSLDRRTKELIALGISIVGNCESCMEWHLHQARKAGATREQVLEAVDVALEMGGLAMEQQMQGNCHITLPKVQAPACPLAPNQQPSLQLAPCP